ncbi:MAG: GDP-mannose 4,6-dehydratase [Anaerolineales bacterium]
MSRALIFGVNGQDGSYLAELLLELGYEVFGWIPLDVPVQMDNISHIVDRLTLIEGSLKNKASLFESVEEIQPDIIYNFASPSSPYDSWDSSIEVGDYAGLGAARLLEAVREIKPDSRYYQASSSELFGNPVEIPQNEKTPFRPRNPYGIAKLYAHWMTVRYRQQFGLFAISGILFNHESPRRGLNFVTRKIANTAVKIKLGMESELRLGDLDARRDWGFAKDYTEAIMLMMQQDSPEDYVIGTGITHSVREFCEIAFNHLGLDYREFVVSDKRFMRPTENKQLVADPSKARSNLNWKPKIEFDQLVTMMVDSDLEELNS